MLRKHERRKEGLPRELACLSILGIRDHPMRMRRTPKGCHAESVPAVADTNLKQRIDTGL